MDVDQLAEARRLIERGARLIAEGRALAEAELRSGRWTVRAAADALGMSPGGVQRMRTRARRRPPTEVDQGHP